MTRTEANWTPEDYIRELRIRISEEPDRISKAILEAVDRMTTDAVILLLHRVDSADLTGVKESLLEAMTEAERFQWRQDRTQDWFRAAERRFETDRAVRQELISLVLMLKAMALAR